MRKQLFVTMLLACGMPFGSSFAAYAEPAPQAQNQTVATITGTVLDENNEPVIGASVMQKGVKANAVTTNFDGNFTIKVAPGTPLQVSYVGYKTETLAAAQGMMVYLQPTTEQLDQLVVVGYGTQKKANLTGAVATVDVARVMDSRPTTDVAKALQGAVPGLTITTGDGAINTTSTIKLRGTGTLSNSQNSSPLIVVDGVPVDDLSFVNPDDIQDISVLKDAASSSIYGTRAAFGVILITTKTPNAKDRVSVKYTNNFGWSQATTLPEFSDVPSQLRALIQTNNRHQVESELFGMYLDKMLPYAEAWQAQNGKPRGYGELRPFQSWENVGDYYQDPVSGATMYYADWDVTGIMYNNAAPSNKHNVSIEGASGKTNYRLAFGYDSRQSLMTYRPDRMRRYNVNANINTQVASWLKVGARFSWSDKVFNGPNTWGSGGTYTYMWRWGSYFNPYGYRKASNGENYEYRMIAAREQSGNYEDVAIDTRMQAYFDATIIKGLTLHGDYTFDVINYDRTKDYQPVYGWNNWTNTATNPEYMVGTSSTYAEQAASRSTLWTVNVYATYENSFNKNNIKVMVGGTAEKYNYKELTGQKNVLGDLLKPYIPLATGGDKGTNMSVGADFSHRATAGFFGRINYDYNGIYLFEANGRYDASSRFPANDQWAFFPSFSAGYRFTEENYFKNLKIENILSNGKIRASYGHIGNEAIGSNMFLATVANETSYWLNDAGQMQAMFSTPKLVSSSLTWERVITTDVGLDLGFFNNSLNLTFDWFQRDTKDMLAPGNTLPAVLGASAPMMNKGHLRTRGWELGIGFNHSFGDADIYANFSIYDGKTTVVKYNNPSMPINGFYDGAVYGDIWGFEYDRYFEESDFAGKDEKGAWIYKDGIASQVGLQSGSFVYGPGDIKFKDLDGDGVISGGNKNMIELNGVTYIPGQAGYEAALANEDHTTVAVGSAKNHGDLKVIGNATPRYEYSFRLGGAWKGFDIDLYFQGVGRRHYWTTSAFVMPFTRGADATYANQNSYNTMEFDGYKIVGYNVDQNNKYPCMYDGAANAGTVSNVAQGRYNFYPQDRYLMNMSYLRFKNLTFGYTLPADLTKKAYIQKARVYFSCDNPCLIYNGMKDYPIDPEIGSQWKTTSSYSNGTFGRTDPMMRTYSFGVQVTF